MVYTKNKSLSDDHHKKAYITGANVVADAGIHLNQGKFRKNGGCGYILKPESLRSEGAGVIFSLITRTQFYSSLSCFISTIGNFIS